MYRLTFILTFLMMCTFPAASNGQKVSLYIEKGTLEDVFDQLSRQTSVRIVFNPLSAEKVVMENINYDKTDLKRVLDEVLKGTDLYYDLVDGTFVVKDRLARQQAPTGRVEGTVLDSNGVPLVGASIVVKGTQHGARANLQGRFEISGLAETKVTLVVSCVGKKTKEIEVGIGSATVFRLEDDAIQMDAVVVTGMFRKSADTFTGSAVTITSEELEQFGSRNILATIRNIDPSFNILENNIYGSDPNKLPDVQIRGSSSIPNVDELQDDARSGLNTPLVILDGFESTLQTLLDMNDNEIESVTILKDASATAIYGSRGANGVIVIETKAPAAGKLKISYRGSLNLEIPDLTSYDLLNAREKLELEKLVGMYDGTGIASVYYLEQYYNYLMSQVNSGVDTYWLAKPLQVGVGQRHNLRAEGGDNTFRYSASVQYNDVRGAMKESVRRNFNATINLSYSLHNLRFSNSTVIGLNNTAESPYGTFDEYARINPYFAPYDSDGNLIKTFGLDGEGAWYRWSSIYVDNGNPLWNSTLNTYDKTNTTTITNNFSIDWNVLEGLIVRGKLGLKKTIGGSDAFYPAEHTRYNDYSQADLLRRGEYINGNSRGYSIDASMNVNYSRTLAEKHQIYAGLNYNMRHSQSTSTKITAEGFVNQDLDFLPMALQYAQGGKPAGSESKSRAVGITGNVNYSYDNRYYVDFTIASDGNSAFGKKNPFATFWSAGLGWNIHNEPFFRENRYVNKLKLRGSTGSNGSQSFNSYQALTTYEYFTDERYFTWLGADVNSLGNPKLKWQQKMNYNAGLEADFIDRRLQLIFDYYVETTRNQISSINIPSSTGFSSYIDNIGKIENRGFEAKLTAVILRNAEHRLYWSVTGSIVYNKNTIKELSQALKDAQAATEADTGSNPYVIYKEGYSMDAIWVVPSLGIDPSTGREIYMDKDGNATWTWNAANLAACGISEPKYKGNINSNMRWRNFQLTASFGYRLGGQLYNSTLINKVENADYNTNVDRRVYTDRWQKAGDNALFKSIYITEVTRKTSRFVQDESTFRCQSLSLTYDFDRKLIEKWNMSNLSLQASMDDLFYISSVKRERGTSYPFSRQMSFSLNITF